MVTGCHDGGVIQANKRTLSKLWNACKHGDVKTVERLAIKKAGANAKAHGMALIHIAARYGNTNTVRYLLSLGANVNAVDEEGWTALHWASAGGHVNVMQLLLVHGTDPKVKPKRVLPLYISLHQTAMKTL